MHIEEPIDRSRLPIACLREKFLSFRMIAPHRFNLRLEIVFPPPSERPILTARAPKSALVEPRGSPLR
jgi:hypothetical protein